MNIRGLEDGRWHAPALCGSHATIAFVGIHSSKSQRNPRGADFSVISPQSIHLTSQHSRGACHFLAGALLGPRGERSAERRAWTTSRRVLSFREVTLGGNVFEFLAGIGKTIRRLSIR
jgi:hypothetical protein